MAVAYRELREIAVAYMRHERADHTLQPTALVNEAMIKLMRTPDKNAADRKRFLGVAAKAMRQVLVDHARSRGAAKRGGGWSRITISAVDSGAGPGDPVDALALDAALTKLAQSEARAAQVVELRFFGGLTIPEAADVLGVSHTTVESDWAFARAWIRKELEGPAT